MRTLAGALAIAVLAFAAGAREGSLRCANRLVFLGAAPVEVFLTCGPPLDVQVRVETISQEIAPGVFTFTPVIVERWTYDSGPNAFVRHLTFGEGTLDDIALGGYGTRR